MNRSTTEARVPGASIYRRTRIVPQPIQDIGSSSFGVTSVERTNQTEGSEAWFEGNAYVYDQCHIFSAWNLLKKGKSCRVAILAGSADRDHPALQNIELTEIDARGSREVPATLDDFTTSVVGLIAGQWHERGFRGVAHGAAVDLLTVHDARGGTTQAEIANALDLAVDRGAKVVVAPLGGRERSDILHDAVRHAVDNGICLIASAGNERDSQPFFPAAFPECLSVCSVDANDKKSQFSSFGDWTSIAAPGEDIWSCGTSESFISLTGTSHSAAIVGGCVALMYSLDPSLTPTDIKRIIQANADSIYSLNPDYSGKLGSGRINAFRALLSIVRDLMRSPVQQKPSS